MSDRTNLLINGDMEYIPPSGYGLPNDTLAGRSNLVDTNLINIMSGATFGVSNYQCSNVGQVSIDFGDCEVISFEIFFCC
jgi:hypothetical protein